MRSPIERDEITKLEKLFGPFPIEPASLELNAEGKAHWWRVLGEDRRAEAALLLPRAGGRLVLISKPEYPEGICRLPTGGIDPEEGVIEAAEREVLEETGLSVQLQRVLGVVDWTFHHQGEARRFATYLCLFPETRGRLEATDPNEMINAYYEMPWESLGRVATRLEEVPLGWESWGRQRALPHRLALALLKSGEIALISRLSSLTKSRSNVKV